MFYPAISGYDEADRPFIPILGQAALKTRDKRMRALWWLNGEPDECHEARHDRLLTQIGMGIERAQRWLAWDELGDMCIYGDALYFAEIMDRPEALSKPDAYFAFMSTDEGALEIAQALAIDGVEQAASHITSGGYYYGGFDVGYSHTFPTGGER